MFSILKWLGAKLQAGKAGNILAIIILISCVGKPALAEQAALGQSGSNIQLAQLMSAEDEQVEIEFWQSVKSSKYIQEFEAYLWAYPNGRFAPLARIRIKQLIPKPDKSTPPKTVSRPQPIQPQRPAVVTTPAPAPPPPIYVQPQVPTRPARQPEIAQPVPPVFQPAPAPVPVLLSDAECRTKYGQHGIAETDAFSSSGMVCSCRVPYQVSVDGGNCIRPFGVTVIPRLRPRPLIVEANLSPTKRTDAKDNASRKTKTSKRRPGKARGRAIANRYCRRKYGSSLTSVVVKKSKFYCHYNVGADGFTAVKKKKFKNL